MKTARQHTSIHKQNKDFHIKIPSDTLEVDNNLTKEHDKQIQQVLTMELQDIGIGKVDC